MVDQFGIAALGAGRDLVEHPVGGFRVGAKTLDVKQCRLQGRRDEALQVAMSGTRFGVLRGDHLALLGEPQRTIHRARRLSQNCVVTRPAATAHCSAATVEQSQPDRSRSGQLHKVQFSPVERPVRGEIATVLVGVGVAQHHLLDLASSIHHRPVERYFERGLQDGCPTLEIVDGLEQRHDCHRRIGALARKIKQACLFEQQRCLKQIRHRLAHRDDVRRYRFSTQGAHSPGGSGDDIEFLARHRRQVCTFTHQRAPGGKLRDQNLNPLRLR